MRLVYLSPVSWSSFAQRPHKFVQWFHANTGGEVLWVEPYPARFPTRSDFRWLKRGSGNENLVNPAWLKLLRPSGLPIEPLPGSGWVNGLIWRHTLHEIDAFAARGTTLLVFGKPSVLALSVLKRLKECRSVYDAMDDFSAFYSGFSRAAMRRREMDLALQVGCILVSSTLLKQRWDEVRSDVQLVHNGLDIDMIPAPKSRPAASNNNVFGYVGTISAWFDWNFVVALAKARPTDTVRLIGPVFTPPPYKLPNNVEMLPPCDHEAALKAMQDFTVGLIPFFKNDLTAAVDPIKYYEYRALGLPVISTNFGEMAYRAKDDGIYISHGVNDIAKLADAALQFQSVAPVSQFLNENKWETRFAAANIL